MLDKILGDRKYFKLLFIFYVFINTLALGYFGIDLWWFDFYIQYHKK